LVLVLAVLLFHRTWPRPFSTQIGAAGDADEYTWFLSWAPFSIAHGLDPLVSRYVAHPGGINLMWNTSVLLPSFVLAPVTAAFGSAFSYNVLATGGPVLDAAFSYLAFRRWTGRFPALAGALIFAFSPFVASQSVGHLAQTLLMSAPLMLIAFDRLLVVQAAKAWQDGLVLGLLGWAQLMTGEEVLAMEAATAAIAIVVLGVAARRQVASHFPHARQGAAVAGCVFAVLAAPVLAVQYFGPDRVQKVHPRNVYATDLLNFVVPTKITQFAPAAAVHLSRHFRGNGSEHGAYIGVPLVIFAVVALVVARRRLVTWVALAIAAGAGILSMGSKLHVAGHTTAVPLPGYVLAHLPLLDNLLPDRFASMTALGVGLLVAVGLDQLKRLRALPAVLSGTLACLGLAAIFPTIHYPNSASPLLTGFETGWVCPPAANGPARPPVALVVPAENELDLRWQAESHFCFAMPTDTGMTGTNAAYRKDLGVLLTVGSPGSALPALTAATRAEAAQEIRRLGIEEIIVAPQSPAVPNWTWADQAQAAAWVQQLVGEAPQKSSDIYYCLVWKSLPPASEIASGRFGPTPAAAPSRR
jgi:hypothetical protein